jgi:hypothetical protein
MNVVAIHRVQDDTQDAAVRLAALMGVTVYEALARLRAPGTGPKIVAVFAEHDQAAQLAGKLKSGGFHSAILTAGEIETESHRRIVKKFTLGDQELGVETAGDGSLMVSYGDVEVILRGTEMGHTTEIQTSKEKSLSLGRAVLTGGIMISKTKKTVREVTTSQREAFFGLYVREGPPLLFRERTLLYETLGPALKLSGAANLLFLLNELRRRCSGARYDERLLNRAGQAALLGPSLDPERHLIVATALLAKVLRIE